MIKELTTALGLIGSIAGGAYFVDDRYALNVHLAQIDQKLDAKILSDQLYQLKERHWNLEDRIQSNPKDKGLKDDLREIDSEQKDLQNKFDSLPRIKTD